MVCADDIFCILSIKGFYSIALFQGADSDQGDVFTFFTGFFLGKDGEFSTHENVEVASHFVNAGI